MSGDLLSDGESRRRGGEIPPRQFVRTYAVQHKSGISLLQIHVQLRKPYLYFMVMAKERVHWPCPA